MGIGPGDVVAITMANTVEFVVSFLAANWIGAVRKTKPLKNVVHSSEL